MTSWTSPRTKKIVCAKQLVGCAFVALLFVGGASIGPAEEVSFSRDIRPLLSDRCFACHGPNENDREATLRLDQAGGPDGAYRAEGETVAIAPGSPDESEVWSRIISDDPDQVMPPPETNKKPFSDKEKQLLQAWIESGAPYEDFWAFVPPVQAELPSVKNRDWSQQAIDLHVLKKLESLALIPSDEADKRTLIRRLTFDLTGLPPTREEVHAFLKDERPQAYEQLIDRLLERKQYGEHMARYWLDLVRFADTNGMHKDFYRNFIAYRDWVIRSFNDNLGYDDFVRYQLAGDLFENPTNDQLIASGFNRLHLIIDRGTALPEESHFKNVVDRVTATGTVFMGMTVHCATCHDHKYDPLTMKDFYSLYAFFNNIDAEPETVRAPPDGLQPPFITLASPEQEKKLANFDQQLAQLDGEIADAKQAAEKEEDPKKKEALAKQTKSTESKRKGIQKQRDQFDKTILRAMVMKEREEIRSSFILHRGQYDAPGEEVHRDTPAFLPELKKKDEVASRMDLAQWFVDRQNPLTARVAVNRFWQQFFGVALVKTSEDIGAQGEVPSHPELLDHLAVSFVDSEWNVKALVKQIVMSKTYRQSSRATPEEFQRDAENRDLARGSRFRLDAEMIRDQILATSGLLSHTMYGRSVKPPQPDGLWKSVTMTGETFKPDQGDDVYRRSLYTFWKRAMPPPQMTILNAPIRDACIARRERTNTPSQALLLLNETEYMKAARKLAQRVLAKKDQNTNDRIDFAHEVVTSKLPDESDRIVLASLAGDLTAYYLDSPSLADDLCDGLTLDSDQAKTELAAWTIVINALYNLDATKNRE